MALRVHTKNPIRRSVTPQRMAAAERRRATVRRTASVAIVLTLVLIAAGVGYTWYMGEQKDTVVATESPEPSRRIEMRPVKQAPNANVGVSVQMLSNPVKAGENASISVRTNQKATCTITVKYGPAASTDSGLIKKIADDYGTVGWSWTVPSGTPPGKAEVKVDCANKAKSGTVTADLIVAA